MRVLTAGVLIVSLFLFSCGDDFGEDKGTCGEKCSTFLPNCPETRAECEAKKIRMDCKRVSFDEAKNTCKVSGCPDNCLPTICCIGFKEEEFDTGYSYVEIFVDPETGGELIVEWFYDEEEE